MRLWATAWESGFVLFHRWLDQVSYGYSRGGTSESQTGLGNAEPFGDWAEKHVIWMANKTPREAGIRHLIFEACASVKVTHFYIRSITRASKLTAVMHTLPALFRQELGLCSFWFCWTPFSSYGAEFLKNSVTFMSRWIGDGLDCQALTAYLHFVVKVVALGGYERRVFRTWGNIEGCNKFVWARRFFVF